MSSNRTKGGVSPQPVSRLLSSGKSGLGQLLSQARQLEQLDRHLATLVDKEIAPLVQVAALRDDCLVLVTPSAALATRLRMDSDSLVRSMAAACRRPISNLKVRVAPLARSQVEDRKRRHLPESAKQSLKRFAADSGDEDLRERLLGESGPDDT